MIALFDKFTTAIAFQDQQESIPTIATIQVLSLFGLTPEIISQETVNDRVNLPDESLLIIVENQIRTVLTKLRRQNYAGAVVILSSTPAKEIKSKYSYLLQYSATTNNTIWRSPYQLSDLLTQINHLEPLSKGNLKLLQENFEKADQEIKLKLTKLQELINNLSELTPNSQERQRQIEEIEKHFETLFSPLSKHTRINLDNYGETTISAHFRQLLREIKETSQPIKRQIKLLNQIILMLHEQIKDLGEDLSLLSEEQK